MTDVASQVAWLRERSPQGIVDCYVNGNPPEHEGYLKSTRYLFKESQADAQSVEELVATME